MRKTSLLLSLLLSVSFMTVACAPSEEAANDEIGEYSEDSVVVNDADESDTDNNTPLNDEETGETEETGSDTDINDPVNDEDTGDIIPYGYLDINFSSDFILDGSKLKDSTYLNANLSKAMKTNVAFSGSYGSSEIPDVTAASSQHYAYRTPNTEKPSTITAMQESYKSDKKTLVAPLAVIRFRSDAITAGGTYTVDWDDNSNSYAYLMVPLDATTNCLAAISFGGTVTVSSSENTANADGGKIVFTGTKIPLYHPTRTPVGDLTSQVGSIVICPAD